MKFESNVTQLLIHLIFIYSSLNSDKDLYVQFFDSSKLFVCVPRDTSMKSGILR